MATYEVDMVSYLTTTITVEADDRDQAIDRAFDSEAMPGQICAQCTGWGSRAFSVDQGEWDVPDKDFSDNPVRVVSKESDDASGD